MQGCSPPPRSNGIRSAYVLAPLTQSFLASPDRRAMQGGVHDTGIPACMDQLVHVLLTEDRLSTDATLGACMEFVLEQDGTHVA